VRILLNRQTKFCQMISQCAGLRGTEIFQSISRPTLNGEMLGSFTNSAGLMAPAGYDDRAL
jgi:hypothetical protein